MKFTSAASTTKFWSPATAPWTALYRSPKFTTSPPPSKTVSKNASPRFSALPFIPSQSTKARQHSVSHGNQERQVCSAVPLCRAQPRGSSRAGQDHPALPPYLTVGTHPLVGHHPGERIPRRRTSLRCLPCKNLFPRALMQKGKRSKGSAFCEH